MAGEVSRQIPDELDLLFDCEPTDDGLENGADCHSVFADQTAVIDVGEDTHQESATLSAKNAKSETSNILAIHSISHSPVPRNAMTEILDVEGTLESGSKETTERCNKRGKNGHDEDMEVVGSVRECRNVSPKL